VGATQTLGRVPWWTIAFVTGAGAAWAIPGAVDILEYDRGALVQGELWRLLTAHFVHYSGAHIINNLPVLVAAMWLVEVRHREDLARLLVMAAVVIGTELFVFDAGIARYAGASGLSVALLTYLTLGGLRGEPRWRMTCVAVLSVLAAKLAAECLFGWQLSDWEGSAGFVTVPLSHAGGAAAGFFVWLRRDMLRGRVRDIRGSHKPDCETKGSKLSSNVA
jgi:rhomboid family GlyGly-CTERM serine protease